MKNLQSWLQKNETFQNKMSDLRRRGKVDKSSKIETILVITMPKN